MVTSGGFFVIGLSGKIRIHNFPSRFIACVIAFRAASIWRELIHEESNACNPKLPNETLVPRVSILRFSERPFCHFLCFTFFGINMQLLPARARYHIPQ